MRLQKVVSLAAVLGRSPREFAERVSASVQVRLEPLRNAPPQYTAAGWPAAADALTRTLGVAFASALHESALADIEAEVRGRLHALRAGPISDLHNGDVLLARCCYAVTRAVKPNVVVETGVAHGVTTTFVLAALAENGSGELHSIDLPPHDAGAETRIGACVPDALRTRWRLHRGMSRRVLPRLVAELDRVDVFIHDSMHTYANMRFEFDTVWQRARVIVADDVELNGAFQQLQERRPRSWTVVQQATKPALFGVVVR